MFAAWRIFFLTERYLSANGEGSQPRFAATRTRDLRGSLRVSLMAIKSLISADPWVVTFASRICVRARANRLPVRHFWSRPCQTRLLFLFLFSLFSFVVSCSYSCDEPRVLTRRENYDSRLSFALASDQEPFAILILSSKRQLGDRFDFFFRFFFFFFLSSTKRRNRIIPFARSRSGTRVS